MNNNIKFILFFLSLGLFMTSCEKEETTFEDISSPENVRGNIITFPNADSSPGFFNLNDPASSSNSFSFSAAEDGETVTSATLNISYNGSTPVDIGSVDMPGTRTLTFEEAIELTGAPLDDIMAGDVFEIGATFTTASGDYRNGKRLRIPVGCLSELAGTYDYEATAVWCGEALTSGTVEFIETSAGRYTLDDWSLGGYTSCYGGPAASWGTLALVDVCSKISIDGLDNYDDTWNFTIDGVDGSALTVSWSNTYGESGSAIITRTDGTDWPALSN